MTIDPKTTAVVLIDYQNHFTSEGGVLHEAVSEVMDQTDMLAHTRRVVAAARSAGATVMHAPITSPKAMARSSITRTAFSRTSSTGARSSRDRGARRSSKT